MKLAAAVSLVVLVLATPCDRVDDASAHPGTPSADTSPLRIGVDQPSEAPFALGAAKPAGSPSPARSHRSGEAALDRGPCSAASPCVARPERTDSRGHAPSPGQPRRDILTSWATTKPPPLGSI